MNFFPLKTKRISNTCNVGGIPIGGGNPIVVQSMTDTDTADIEKTVKQIILLANAGSEIVRITVNNDKAAKAVPEIVKRIKASGCPVPIVGDFHFNGHVLLKKYPEMAKSLSKLRINPGNVGRGPRHDKNFVTFIEIAKDFNKPIRIGVNAGSLDPEVLAKRMDENAKNNFPLSSEEVEIEALVDSALSSAETAIDLGLPENMIIISCKVSRVQEMVTVYRKIAENCNLPLHLGLTEAGMGLKGVASTSSALSILLSEGIGDTIRSSLTPEVGGDRSKEVRLCQEILQALGLRSFRPSVTSCPGCGRTTSTFFRELAENIQNEIDSNMKNWKKVFPGVEDLKIAIMGCIVNGPGESKSADIGISLPGTGEDPKVPVYIDGKLDRTLSGSSISDEFVDIVENYIKGRWG